MQTIKIANSDVIQAPPQGQPDLPGQQSNPSGKPPETGQKPPVSGIPGTVSENEVFKAVEGTKISTLSTMQTDPLMGQPLGQQGSSVPVGGLIDGGLAVELMDALLPSLLVALMAAIGAQMKKTDLQLTAKEKNTLTPLMQKCMDQLMINFQSPFAALGVSLLVIYGAKVTEHGVIQIIDKKAEKAARDREQKKQAETIKTTAAPVNISEQPKQPVPVVPITTVTPNKTGRFGPEKKPLSKNWQPTPEQLWEGKRRVKGSEKEVIERMQREHAAGTLDKFFKKPPYKK